MKRSEPYLEIEDLRWSFPGSERTFIDIPFFQAKKGEVVALTGPSGSGKSTLLFLLAALEKNLQGRVCWGSFDIVTASEKSKNVWRQKKLGMVFQDFQLIGQLTVLENVLLPRSFSSWKVDDKVRRDACEMLERLGLGKRMSAPAYQLSRGEMQRCAIARALFKLPDVILADEPTASLDAENEKQVAALLLESAREQGATLIVSTHHAILRESADTVLVIEHGFLKEYENV